MTVYILGLLAAVVVFWDYCGGSSGRTVLTLSIKGSSDFGIIILKWKIVGMISRKLLSSMGVDGGL